MAVRGTTDARGDMCVELQGVDKIRPQFTLKGSDGKLRTYEAIVLVQETEDAIMSDAAQLKIRAAVACLLEHYLQNTEYENLSLLKLKITSQNKIEVFYGNLDVTKSVEGKAGNIDKRTRAVFNRIRKIPGDEISEKELIEEIRDAIVETHGSRSAQQHSAIVINIFFKKAPASAKPATAQPVAAATTALAVDTAPKKKERKFYEAARELLEAADPESLGDQKNLLKKGFEEKSNEFAEEMGDAIQYGIAHVDHIKYPNYQLNSEELQRAALIKVIYWLATGDEINDLKYLQQLYEAIFTKEKLSAEITMEAIDELVVWHKSGLSQPSS